MKLKMTQEVKKKIAAAFAANKKAQEFFATANGHCFEKESQAREAAKSLDDKKPKHVKRDEFATEIAEVSKPVEPTAPKKSSGKKGKNDSTEKDEGEGQP
jgi:hypothetical protein